MAAYDIRTDSQYAVKPDADVVHLDRSVVIGVRRVITGERRPVQEEPEEHANRVRDVEEAVGVRVSAMKKSRLAFIGGRVPVPVA